MQSSSSSSSRPLLFLDLDHTLIHSHKTLFPGVRDHFEIPGYHVHVRPHALAFLQLLARKKDTLGVGVWTAGTRDYAKDVLDGLLKLANLDRASFLEAVYSRESRHTHRLPSGMYVKRLRPVEEELGRDVYLLDDDPTHRTKDNGHRVIPCRKYDADKRGDGGETGGETGGNAGLVDVFKEVVARVGETR